MAGVLARDIGVVLAKGGVTSALVARNGLGSEIADIIGPSAAGGRVLAASPHVERALLPRPSLYVATDEALADVVGLILAA